MKNLFGLFLFWVGVNIVGASMNLITDKDIQNELGKKIAEAWNTSNA